MVEQSISLHNQSIGRVLLDLADIRGEGGWHDPRLVIPLTFHLNPQPVERQLILIRLTASLHLSEAIGQANQFAERISYDPTLNMQIRSLAEGVSDDGLELSFNLTHEQIKLLEEMRHQPGKHLYLQLEPIIVWNKRTGNQARYHLGQRVNNPQEDGGWSLNVGLYSEFAYFWQVTVGTMSLDLTALQWAERIFPGLGYDRFRLLEITLPSASRLVPDEAIIFFEQARKEYYIG